MIKCLDQITNYFIFLAHIHNVIMNKKNSQFIVTDFNSMYILICIIVHVMSNT